MRPQNTKHYYRALRIDLFLGVLTPIINFIAERKDHKQSTLKTYFIIMKTIKFLSLLMLVALSAGFASCSDDDDVDSEALLGTWEATYTEGWYKDTDYPKDNADWKGTWAQYGDDSMLPAVLTLGKDGKGTYRYDYNVRDYPCTWSVNGNKFSFTTTDENGKDDTATVKVVSQTDTELQVEFSYKKDSESGYEKTTYKKK